MVGGFVEPVGVFGRVLIIRLNVTNLVLNCKTHENNDFYMDWTKIVIHNYFTLKYTKWKFLD